MTLQIPVIGEVVRKATIARWTRTLATMFAAGVPLVDALDSVAGAAGNFLLGASWSTCVGIAGAHAGLVSACMNTAGQVGGFVSPIIAASFANWSHALALTAALYFFGAICWLFVEPHKHLFENNDV